MKSFHVTKDSFVNSLIRASLLIWFVKAVHLNGFDMKKKYIYSLKSFNRHQSESAEQQPLSTQD